MKSSSDQLAKRKTASLNQSQQDIKAVIQHTLELMAMSEVTKFPNEKIPLLCVYGGKMSFVPYYILDWMYC